MSDNTLYAVLGLSSMAVLLLTVWIIAWGERGDACKHHDHTTKEI